MKKPNLNFTGDGESLVSHLVELRDRLLRCVVVVLVVFLALVGFANDLFAFVALPLQAALPENATMIAIDPVSPLITPLKLTLVASIFIAIPFLLYQVWAFIAPGLYKNEKRVAWPLLFSSVFLFYLGMAFAYFVVFPLIFAFLTSTTPDNVAMMTDITRYLDFLLTLFFAFGVGFEVPVATVLLVWIGVTTPAQLSAARPYVVVAAFVIGMLLTPPDVVSQILLALPMWVLYEIGILCSRWLPKSTDEEDSPAAA